MQACRGGGRRDRGEQELGKCKMHGGVRGKQAAVKVLCVDRGHLNPNRFLVGPYLDYLWELTDARLAF